MHVRYLVFATLLFVLALFQPCPPLPPPLPCEYASLDAKHVQATYGYSLHNYTLHMAALSLDQRRVFVQKYCTRDDMVFDTGVFCFTEYIRQFLVAYHPLSDRLLELFGNLDVVEFGAGLGEVGRYLLSNNMKGSYQAFDGAYNAEDFTGGLVTYADMSVPVFYSADWVLSLEVGEHIPAKFQDVFILNLVKNARVGIVLSWAVPGQGGHAHVNERPNADVIAQMGGLGFDHDGNTTALLRQNAGEHKYLENSLMVFRRNSFTKYNTW